MGLFPAYGLTYPRDASKSDNKMDPTQSTDPVVSDIDTNPKPTTPVIPEAVQERFNELTAERHEMRRQLDQQNQNMQELMAQNAALALRISTPAPAQEAVPEGVDPNMVDYFNKTMGATLKRELQSVKQEMNQVVGRLAASQQQTELQQVIAGVDPKLASETQKVYASWAGNPALAGWNARDALRYARGVLDEQKEATTRRNTPNGIGSDAITPGGGVAPNPVVNRNLPAPKTDQELKRMSLAQQDAYWAGRVGDSEIIY